MGDDDFVFDDGRRVAEIAIEEAKIDVAVTDYETRLRERKQNAQQQKEQAVAELKFLEEKVIKKAQEKPDLCF